MAIIVLLVGFCFMVACENVSGSSASVGKSTSSTEEVKQYSNEVQVVVLLGQSNMEGNSHNQYLTKTVGAERASAFTAGYEKVKISYLNTVDGNSSGGQFVPTKVGQGYTVDRFGPEVGIAESVSAIDPIKPVYIIKYAYGGTTLVNQWRSPSSRNTGVLYTGAVKYILDQCKKLEDMDLYPIIKAICWMQGESDASGSSYPQYGELEDNFVSDLRKDLAYYKDVEGEIYFVDAGISDCPAWTQYVAVNNAKKALADADEYHFYIDTIAEGLKYNAEPVGAPDIYHYDSSSEIKLGNLFAQVLLGQCLEI